MCLFLKWEGIAGVVSLRVEELSVHLETKTKDNVFVDMNVTGTKLF